jgi:photosystem II stability/assembly factor-like uncharacterized protein
LMMALLRTLWLRLISVTAVILLCYGCSGPFLASLDSNPWQVVTLPTESTLLDLAFTDDRNHGWLVGSNNTLLETVDGGKTWEGLDLDLGDQQKYRLTSISFSGQEGWVTGQPSLLLHTDDGGKSWATVPLSSRLPGAPNTIVALGDQSAEMTTDVGAIYRTTDGGRNWKAMVESAFGVVRNIARSTDGKYVAVSSTGSFYSIWEPGQEAWVPYNRNSSRRVQNMGFTPQGTFWLLARGGQLQFSNSDSAEDWGEVTSPETATSWGFLDLAYRTPDELWISGGSGNLLYSGDGGKTWQKDRALENVPSNLYKIVFVNPDQGFILGQRGTLLKYAPSTEAA